ncbi:hypothetical protein DBR32_11995 [Taibaiella sp. KBW10]|nr:hypothetical protein DBR32_11995 [Taibaiella sp. KBW10]
MSNYDLIKQAILEKKQIIASYNGYYREMCPHAIGTKKGREQAIFYQFGGDSSSGPVSPGDKSNWRCIPVAGLDQVMIRDGEWHTADNHSTPSTCIDFIDVQVKF